MRDPDEVEYNGCIMTSVNCPSAEWNDPDYVRAVLNIHSSKKDIFIHCAKSQVRGPACATMLLRELSKVRGRLIQEGGESNPALSNLPSM